jgi:hypothetical protein
MQKWMQRTTYVDSTTQLNSVPYAPYAENAVKWGEAERVSRWRSTAGVTNLIPIKLTLTLKLKSGQGYRGERLINASKLPS